MITKCKNIISICLSSQSRSSSFGRMTRKCWWFILWKYNPLTRRRNHHWRSWLHLNCHESYQWIYAMDGLTYCFWSSHIFWLCYSDKQWPHIYQQRETQIYLKDNCRYYDCNFSLYRCQICCQSLLKWFAPYLCYAYISQTFHLLYDILSTHPYNTCFLMARWTISSIY